MYSFKNKIVFNKKLLVGFLLTCFLVACGSGENLGTSSDSQPVTNKELPNITTSTQVFDLWNGQGSTGTPTYPRSPHLRYCSSASVDNYVCPDLLTCVNLGEGSKCFYKCDPKKGTREKQNPDCIEPENCIELNDGSGICVYFPAQLYGSGNYKALVRKQKGEKCLLQYDGCDEGFICVDQKNNGSIGECVEKCAPATLPDSKVQPVCKTANTTCKRLASGFGACL